MPADPRSVRRARARAALLIAALAAPAAAQVQAPPSTMLDVSYDSGAIANTGADPAIVIAFVVDLPGAEWTQLHFDELDLAGDVYGGTGSILRLTSLQDGALQTMNAVHVAQWHDLSAYFNGSGVLVEVLAQPGTGPNRVAIDRATVGVPDGVLESQCGPIDDRVHSSDPRACRLMNIGCTGWLIDDCKNCMLTAGHCSAGSLIAEFNVPPSTSGGTVVHPPPSDQYSVDLASVQSNGGQGTGNDWAYLGVFPNSTTGLTPFQAQGQAFAVIGQSVPPFNPAQLIRITGYGVDTGVDNQVQQTHTGPWSTSSGTLLQYQVDTTGGNSGSPIIHEATGRAIGIHTHGGCATSNPPSGANSGTAIPHAGLQAALANPRGICEFSVDPIDLPAVLEPGVAETVRVQIFGAILPGSATLWFRYDGGVYQSQTMASLGGGVYEGTLTATSCSDVPEYFFTADSTSCGTVANPPSAPAMAYSTEVGTPVPILVDNFETDIGWTVMNQGPVTTGSWQRAVPGNFAGGDPGADFDGSGQCYVTQNTSQADLDGGTTILTSPPIDMSGGAIVSYAYWLNDVPALPLGAEDSLQVQMATNAAGTDWSLLRDYRTIAGSWREDAILVGFELPATSTMRIRFLASDLSPGNVLEAAIDAVRVSRVVCAETGTPFCLGDGSGTPCPCGNVSASGEARGCAHSFGGGGQLVASGDAIVSADTLVLDVVDLPPTTIVLFFQGSTAENGGLGSPFGDGLLCASGSVVRLQGKTTFAGAARFPTSGASVSTAGGIPGGGGTFYYQGWFRNQQSFCTPAQFNLTNGLAISWAP